MYWCVCGWCGAVEMDGIATSEQRSRPSYKDWFEHQLIGVTTDYYDAEANRLLGDASFSFVDFANYVRVASPFYVFSFFVIFLFGSVRQTKLATPQLLGAR